MLTARIALIDHVETDDRRAGTSRSAINRPSTLRLEDGAPRDVEIEDLSSRGFSFSFAEPVPVAVGDRIRVGLAGAGRVQARVVRRDGRRVACMFEPELTTRQLAEAFASSAVIESRFVPESEIGTVPDPDVGKWPGAIRFGTLVIGAAAGWAIVVSVARLVASA